MPLATSARAEINPRPRARLRARSSACCRLMCVTVRTYEQMSTVSHMGHCRAAGPHDAIAPEDHRVTLMDQNHITCDLLQRPGRGVAVECRPPAVSRTALKPLQPADARVEACQSRRSQASHRRRLYLRDGVRDRAPQPQGGAGRRVGERAGGWHLGDAAVRGGQGYSLALPAQGRSKLRPYCGICTT